VTHDEDLASKCEMKIYMKDGEVKEIVGLNNKQPIVKKGSKK